MKTLVGFITMLEQQRNEMVMFLAFFLLWATQISFAIEQWRKRHGSEVDRWLRAVGEMEALCSLASFAFERPEYPFPEIVEGSTVLEAEDVRHPLLLRAQCVPNTITLGGDLQCWSSVVQHVRQEHASSNRRNERYPRTCGAR